MTRYFKYSDQDNELIGVYCGDDDKAIAFRNKMFEDLRGFIVEEIDKDEYGICEQYIEKFNELQEILKEIKKWK